MQSSTSTKKMSTQYIYSEDQAIIIQDGAIIWNNQSADQSCLDYFDANDTALNDSNETTINEAYVTAIDSDETQYLSVLEQSDVSESTLEGSQNFIVDNDDISATGITANTCPKIEAKNVQENNSEESDNGEVIVFTMDGSDDLYGVQVSHDEAGNIQKYQFKFRTTPEGELEPIPETVTLLPPDDQLMQQMVAENLETETEESELAEGQEYVVVQEKNDTQSCNEVVSQNDDESFCFKGSPKHMEDRMENENVDSGILDPCIDAAAERDANLESHLENLCIKTEIVETRIDKSNALATIKEEEYLEADNEDEFQDDFFDQTIHYNAVCEEEEEVLSTMHQDNEEANLEQMESVPDNHHLSNCERGDCQGEELYQHFMSDTSRIEVEYQAEEVKGQGRRAEENDYNVEKYLEETTENIANNSQTGPYQIVETYTEETIESAPNPNGGYQEPKLQNSNISKHPLAESGNEDKSRKPLVSVNYYVVYPEKENVNSLETGDKAQPKLMKPNPRSVLRPSYFKQDKRQKLSADVPPDCDMFHKRFAKNKDAMHAKHFHNFLNRTTILHAPVRQQRQPRKQKIKPVTERSDEEIIVQEVLVSSGGFIENIHKKLENKNIQVTAIVELSDSEDDTETLGGIDHLLRSSAQTEGNVIEINSDNEEPDSRKKNETNLGSKTAATNIPVTFKRRRGRPPKNRKKRDSDIELSSNKRSCLELNKPVSSVTSNDKKEFKCPFCSKTFPSGNSLNTHKIHHNLENCLKNKTMNSTKPKFEYSHRCENCQETFKNTILLQKHNCQTSNSTHSCSICLKEFRDITMFNIHKRSHAKTNLVKNTSVMRISPKKIAHRASTSSLMKSPKPKSPKKTFKCGECPKVCCSEEIFNNHIKIHRKFVCSSCFLTFSSKLLLDTHVRTNCVKLKANSKQRMSYTIRKSFVHTPPRRLSVAPSNKTNINNTMCNSSALLVKLDCDKCSMKFSTFRGLYTHKVQKHGMDTPDKSLLTKPKQGNYKPKPAHGGIPANDRLKKAFASLRKKLAETENLTVEQ